ncbi:hypothetical protein ABK040_003880 [Willaertia magna]
MSALKFWCDDNIVFEIVQFLLGKSTESIFVKDRTLNLLLVNSSFYKVIVSKIRPFHFTRMMKFYDDVYLKNHLHFSSFLNVVNNCNKRIELFNTERSRYWTHLNVTMERYSLICVLQRKWNSSKSFRASKPYGFVKLLPSTIRNDLEFFAYLLQLGYPIRVLTCASSELKSNVSLKYFLNYLISRNNYYATYYLIEHYPILKQIEKKKLLNFIPLIYYNKKTKQLDLTTYNDDIIDFYEEINSDFILKQINNCTLALKFVPDLDIKNLIIKALSRNGLVIRYLQNNKCVNENYQVMCETAVMQNGVALKYVDKSKLSDPIAVYKKAVENDGKAIRFIDEHFVNDDLCRIAVQQNSNALDHIKNTNSYFYCNDDNWHYVKGRAFQRHYGRTVSNYARYDIF